MRDKPHLRHRPSATAKRSVMSGTNLLRAIMRETSGNALMILAFSLLPLLALVGSSIDMGRAYLVQARLQQACDAGVLGARKELGAIDNFSADANGAQVSSKGNRFFNVNFGDGFYNSIDRNFEMAIEDDMSISGEASVIVPTEIMQFFGKDEIPIDVTCRAELNIPNTDIMMALDVTGSMAETNSGDTAPKIAVLKTVVKEFYGTMEMNRQPESRIRYGFVPYSTNVNVGSLLRDSWVVPSWNYPSRTLVGNGSSSGLYGYYSASSPVSGTYYTTTATSAATRTWTGAYVCNTPANTLTTTTPLVSTTTQAVTNPSGTRTIYTYNRTRNGNVYSMHLSGTTCTLTTTTYASYIDTYRYITEPGLGTGSNWLYKDVNKSTTNWRTESNGCIEERATYEIDDYDNVDLDRAKDLDIDTVPTAGDPDTQWRPMYPAIIYERSRLWNGTGAFTSASVGTNAEFVAPYLAGFAACPTPAKKLQEWTQADFDGYIDGLVAAGSTYHDIGMIWAARLLSPTGIFASENADVSSRQRTSRHLIFLTDGQTSSLDLSYSSYGVEPISARRWSAASPLTLTQTIEKRFSFACEEAKKKNITVWFVAFGTELNPIMTTCAGNGHYFSAANSAELQDAFRTIAKSIGDLRLAS